MIIKEVCTYFSKLTKAKRKKKKAPKSWTKEYFVEVETKNLSELNELLDETRAAADHLTDCLNRLNNFKLKIEASVADD
ncbi:MULTISPECIES: hypothetical protein [unclassified Streptococcus]|uniref:hypothetical protein n=1 Tax=unclassified Streptococcus TaxID=2608887 RepID=UPI00211B0AD1|nr:MULTISPECIES: hypothetical protein [unclassified Streptococcus]MCQ9211830.1 hypothetical protein [Streptococcus sp. B01]MCQ9212950.1 hypothetical protein [Streptococcus sp. O1]